MIETLDISPIRLSDMVAERIANAIIDGSLPAGSRVRDQDLAEQLGVSRMPVREALQRLQRIGLIETAASRYTRVTNVTPTLAEATRVFAGHYMVSMVRMAIAGSTPAQRQDAAVTIDAIIARLLNDGSTRPARRELHALLVSLADNVFMAAMASDLAIAIQRNLSTTSLPLDTADELAASFRALRGAIVEGDSREAELIIRAQYGIEDQ